MAPVILLLLLVQASPRRPFAYRGFAPGMAYRIFATRARSIAQGDSDILACQTMHTTAQVMDCGVRVRDPVDSARFYLSANVIEGRTSVIAFVDSGKVALVRRTQDDMRKHLGVPQRRELVCGMDQGPALHPAQLARGSGLARDLDYAERPRRDGPDRSLSAARAATGAARAPGEEALAQSAETRRSASCAIPCTPVIWFIQRGGNATSRIARPAGRPRRPHSCRCRRPPGERDERLLERAVVRREPERDFHAVNYVARLTGSRDRRSLSASRSTR